MTKATEAGFLLHWPRAESWQKRLVATKPAVAVDAGVLALVSTTTTTTTGAKVMAAAAASIYCAGRASGWMAERKVAKGERAGRMRYVGPSGSRFGHAPSGLELRPDREGSACRPADGDSTMGLQLASSQTFSPDRRG